MAPKARVGPHLGGVGDQGVVWRMLVVVVVEVCGGPGMPKLRSVVRSVVVVREVSIGPQAPSASTPSSTAEPRQVLKIRVI